jgi:hypothetical protein
MFSTNEGVIYGIKFVNRISDCFGKSKPIMRFSASACVAA